MSTPTVGIIHPGAMGSSMGAALAGRADVIFAGSGRSTETCGRAEADGIRDVGDMDALVSAADVIISVCPPHACQSVVVDVLRRGFTGVLVDANAISPATARLMNKRVESDGGSFVDGGVVGPPVRHAGTTTLLLSGREAERIAELFAGTALEPRVIDDRAGSASALMMAFSAWTKGTTALHASIRALAEAEGVSEALQTQASLLLPDLASDADRRLAASGPKAWRYIGEMKEISRTFSDHGLAEGFHVAAADVYGAIAEAVAAGQGTLDADALVSALAARGASAGRR